MSTQYTSLRQQAGQVAAGECTSESLVRRALDRIAARDGQVNAFVSVMAEQAIAHARDVDRRVAAGESVGALAGVPVAIKDNMCTDANAAYTEGATTTCGSRILEQFKAPYDAHVVERLRAADAVIVGKCNLDEFAMGSSTENSSLKTTRNPWNADYVPGGSSGGSAAAVAADMVPATLGSDTGGSIRQPASLCGVVGLKPTYGRVSRYGLVAYGSSLDQIGPFTRTVEDAAAMLQAIAGHDHRDSTSADDGRAPVGDYVGQLDAPVEGLRIGVIKEFDTEGLDDQVRSSVTAAVDAFRANGATVEELSLKHLNYSIACYYLIATAEASSNLARYDGVHYGHRTDAVDDDIVDLYSVSRAEGFGDEVKRRIMLGTYALSSGYYDAYYLKALKVRTLIRRDFEAAFEKVDCLMCPTSPTAAFRIGEKTDDPLTMYLSDVYTIAVNLAGIPAMSVPCGFTRDSLPIGLQIISPAFDEQRMLRIARMHEQMNDAWTRQPLIAGNE